MQSDSQYDLLSNPGNATHYVYDNDNEFFI